MGGTQMIPIDDPKEIKKYFDQFMKTFEFKCIRFRYPEYRRNLNVDLMSDFVPQQKYFVKIRGTRFNPSDEELYFLLFVHDADQYPRGYDIRLYEGRFFDGSEGKYIAYQSITTEYLPPPFFSMCTYGYQQQFGKQSVRLESKEDCTESCVYERYQKRLPGKVSRSLTYSTPVKMRGDNDYSNESFWRFFEVYDKCRSECPLKCRTNIFLPTLAGDYSYASNTFRLYVKHDNPTIRVNFSPKITAYEFIIYIASIASLWIGFSAFHFMLSLTPIIKHLFVDKRKKLKVVINQRVFLK